MIDTIFYIRLMKTIQKSSSEKKLTEVQETINSNKTKTTTKQYNNQDTRTTNSNKNQKTRNYKCNTTTTNMNKYQDNTLPPTYIF